MRKGEFTWRETIYENVTVAEIPKVVMKLLVDRDPADGSPVKVEPECDGTYTISYRWFESSKWDDEDHERPMTQEEVNHLCDTCPEACELTESQEAARELAEDILRNPDRKCTLRFEQKYLPVVLQAIHNMTEVGMTVGHEEDEDA